MEGVAPTDEELVAAAQAGDTSAFDALVRRWDRKIHGAIYRVLGSDDEARDISQEAFLKAFRGLGAFKGHARFSSWLYQIAINLCRDRLRRRRVRATVSLEELERAGPVLVERAPGAHEALVRQDLASAVRRAIAELSPEQREVLILKEYQELTFPEIAEALCVPVSTVKTRLYRGLVQLRLRLEQEGVGGAAPLPVPAP